MQEDVCRHERKTQLREVLQRHRNGDASGNTEFTVDEVFSKGLHGACYSGFEGNADSDQTSLSDWLRRRGITEVEIVGLATDHCVRATALDAIAAGFTTTVLLDHCAGVAPDTTVTAIATMSSAGVILVK